MAEPPPAPAIPMAEPPPAVPQLLPPLRRPPPPQLLPPLHRPLSPLSHATSSTPSKRRVMAEPPPALPQPPGVPVAAAPLHLMTSSITGAQLVAPTSAPDHVAQNPSIGDYGEVESRAGASTTEVLPEISTCVSTLTDAKILMEEDGVAGDGSTSLSTICARRAPGRPKVQRHKIGAENSKGKGKNGQQQCPICKEFGHRWQSCKNAAPEALEAYAEVAKEKKKQKKKPITKAICTTSDHAIEGTVPPLPCTTETENALAIEDKTAKLTSSKTTSKSKRSKIISAAPDSHAMSTRSKKRGAPNSQPMATRSKKKLKL